MHDNKASKDKIAKNVPNYLFFFFFALPLVVTVFVSSVSRLDIVI